MSAVMRYNLGTALQALALMPAIPLRLVAMPSEHRHSVLALAKCSAIKLSGVLTARYPLIATLG